RAPSREPGGRAAPYWPERGCPGRAAAAGGPPGTAWHRRLRPPGRAGRGRRRSRYGSHCAPSPVAYGETPPPVTTSTAAGRVVSLPCWEWFAVGPGPGLLRAGAAAHGARPGERRGRCALG